MSELPSETGAERLQWQRIRRDYKTTEISWRNLAARHGDRTPGTIRRRAKSEGWARIVEAITARLVTRAVAAVGRTVEHEGDVESGVCANCARCARGFAQPAADASRSTTKPETLAAITIRRAPSG
jgi:hypothetical protein